MDRSPTPARDYRRYTTLEEGLDASSANSHLDGSGARARRELRRRRPLRTGAHAGSPHGRSEEHTSELQSRSDLVCRLLLEKKKRAASGSGSTAAGPARAL